MEEGVIAELTERNSGFIKRSYEQENLFFHSESLSGLTFAELRVGDAVAFVVTESKKGPYAIQVCKA